MMRCVLVFCVTILFSGVLAFESTQVDQCINKQGGLPINVLLEGCESPPCEVKQLEYVTLNLVFQVPRTMRTMKTKAYATTFGIISVDYDLGPESVTCNFFTNTYCPVLAGEVVTYTLKMYIEPWMPAGTSATVEFYIQGEDEDVPVPVMCFRMPIRVVRADPTRALDEEETKVEKPLEEETVKLVP